MKNSNAPMRAILLVLLMVCSTMVHFLEPVSKEDRDELSKPVESSFTGGANATFGPSTISIGKWGNMCLIYSNGNPMCKGPNSNGQLGDGTTNTSSVPVNTLIPAGRKAKSIHTGESSSCMVLDNGSAMCWGLNSEAGQLGLGDSVNRNSPAYVVLPSGVSAEHIEVERYSSCILLTNGSMMCSGRYWALGNGATSHSNVPQYVSLPAGRTVSQFSTSYWKTCAVLDNSSAMCWGMGSNGGLGDGTNNNSNYPVYVQTPNGIGVKSISVGYEFACMILTDGSLYCWGENDFGQLGDGTTNSSYSPSPVSLPANVSANHVSAGFYHACADFSDGKVRCWGNSGVGNLGDGQSYSSGYYATEPVNVSMPAGVNVLNFTSGQMGTCTLNSNLSALCWGMSTNTPVYTFSSVYQYAKPGDPIINLPANGSISASLEFDFINMRLKGDWQASNLVTGYEYNVSWSLKYQNNGTVISNGWPDSFYGNSPNQSNAAVRSWSSGFLYGETICYEITLRYGDGFTGTALDNSTSCTNTPVQLSSLSSNEVLGALQRSSSGNCEASSSSSSLSSARICDNNTGTEWVSGSDTNNAEEEITIDFDLGSTPVKVNAVAAYVNNDWYLSTIKDVRLQFLNETGDYQTIGIFQIQQATGWQLFGGFSVMTTEIRWDILSNHGYSHTVLFEGRILDVPDKIFNSTADWNSIESENSHSVALGDVDGDGDLDLAVANALQNNRLYLNNGNNFSTSPVWTSSNSLNSRDMAWGDVDGDGDLDLAVANHNGKNEIYFNSGTGLATTPGWQSSNSWSSVSVSWGDIDGDGDLDLAVGNQAHQNEVYLNDGSTLGTNSYWTSSNSLNTNSAIWGDVDGDGDLDLAVGSYDTNNEVYLNDGSTLENTPSWTSSNSQYTLMLAWGDIDGDGDLDLAVGNRHQSNEIYLNTGTSLSTTPSFVTTETTSTNWISLGDLDGDGTLDMIAGNREHASTNSSSSNQVYFNSGSTLQSSAAWTGNARETYGTALGDVDGDGDLDLVVANKNSESNELFFNQLDNGGAGADGLPDIDIGGPGDSEFSGKNLATGYEHNCAIQKNQTLRCWGGNWHGQLGNQQYQEQSYATPLYDVELPQGTIPIDVSVTESYSCVIVRNISNDAYCWGRGVSGKLGDGDSSDSSKPEDKVILPAGVNPIAISSGRAHSCLVSDDGDIYCWGENGRGQLGDGTSGGFSSTPSLVQVADVDFVSIAVGNEHSCAITSEGALYCWGGNWDGQLGDGTWQDSASPVEISSQESWKYVESSGNAHHSCAISNSDELWCWGQNYNGQLGDGTTSNANSPQLVQQLSQNLKVIEISVGGYGTSCAVLEDSSTYCWGINARGYLGDGTWQSSLIPSRVLLPEGSEVVEISSGHEHSCVLLANDQIMCWGFGNGGVLGNGDHSDVGYPHFVSGEHVWNGLGKDFYHLSPSLIYSSESSEPKLSVEMPLSSIPTGLSVDISQRIFFFHQNGIMISSFLEDIDLQSINGTVWTNEFSFHDEIPSISGNNNRYCIEYYLNSNVTGDSIGYGIDCEWYNPPNSGDDFAPDDFEDVWGTSTDSHDTDDDGYEDWFEYWFGGDATDAGITPDDLDMDGLPDNLELALNSNRSNTDTDGDGHQDLDEFLYGGHLLKIWEFPPNSDYDDCYDYWEAWQGLNNSNSDTDGDGVIDCFDTDGLDPDNTPLDTDGDGMPDSLEEDFGTNSSDWDSDGDGMPDSFEYILGSDPWDENSHYTDWAVDWSNLLTDGPNVSISASSAKQNHPASLAIDSSAYDQNYDTYWQSEGACPATLEIDLGRAQYFSHLDFEIEVLAPGHHPTNYTIEYRESNSDSWTVHETWIRNGATQFNDYWEGKGTTLPLPKARYVRFNCSDSTDNSGTSQEIAISGFRIWDVKNTQFINPHGIPDVDSGEPQVDAFLNVDSANETLTAGYSAQLNQGLDYDLEWRLVEVEQGSCSDVPLSIDQGTVNINNWNIADNNTFQQFSVDYSSISNWYTKFCLQIELMQAGNSLDVDWLLIDNTGSVNNENFITIRYYANYKGWAHESGSHYNVIAVEQAFTNCLLDDGDLTDTEDVAHAVACHYVFGHPSSNWESTYSPSANNPWVGSYLRSDGEIRPFLLSEMSGLPQYESGWGLFIPEDQINQISESSTGLDLPILDFLTNTSNYVTFTFEYSNSDGSNNGSNGSNQTLVDTDGDGVEDLIDLCAGTSPGVQVDVVGCPIEEPSTNVTHNTTLEAEFIEQQIDGIWNQKIELIIEDPWKGYNHSLSVKISDPDENTIYSYFSPVDEDDSQSGWWILFTDSDVDSVELNINLNWDGHLESGYWKSSTRFFEDNEYPYFESGEYCLEVSLGYQINSSDSPMSSVNNIVDSAIFCGTFDHDSMEGVIWDGTVEKEQGLIDRLSSNAIVTKVLDFMDSTTGQIISILLGILAFAGRMVLARGQRSKNKRVRKFSERIRKAETVGRLKIIEQDIDKANDKNKLPRGGYGDLMEQIEAQMEKLGFDGNPQDGQTSGDWSSDDGANEWQDDFQQAADMMWDAQDMMAEAREEAAMARQAIEDMQQQMGHTPQRTRAQESEPEEAFSSKYVTSGIDSSAAGSSGPSLPSSRIMDLDGDGVVSQEEKEIWNAMSQEERAEFFSPITNIAEEIRRRQILNEKREKMNKKRGGKKDKKRKKKDKRW